jgi:hypothetical protein
MPFDRRLDDILSNAVVSGKLEPNIYKLVWMLRQMWGARGALVTQGDPPALPGWQ